MLPGRMDPRSPDAMPPGPRFGFSGGVPTPLQSPTIPSLPGSCGSTLGEGSPYTPSVPNEEQSLYQHPSFSSKDGGSQALSPASKIKISDCQAKEVHSSSLTQLKEPLGFPDDLADAPSLLPATRNHEKYEDSIELLTTAEILQLSQEGRLYSQKDFEKIEAILKDQGIDPDQLMSQSIVLTPSLPPSQPTDQPDGSHPSSHIAGLPAPRKASTGPTLPLMTVEVRDTPDGAWVRKSAKDLSQILKAGSYVRSCGPNKAITIPRRIHPRILPNSGWTLEENGSKRGRDCFYWNTNVEEKYSKMSYGEYYRCTAYKPGKKTRCTAKMRMMPDGRIEHKGLHHHDRDIQG